jgi:spore maturation protein CgeB
LNDISIIERLNGIKKRKIELTEEIKKFKNHSNKEVNIPRSNWWFVTNDNYSIIPSDNGLLVQTSGGKHVYISYLENNITFSKAPSHSLNGLIEENLSVLLSGKLTANLVATLYIITYKDGKKSKVFQIQMNEKKVINMPVLDVDEIRIAIKLEGSGEFTFDNLQIGKINLPLYNKNQEIMVNESIGGLSLNQFQHQYNLPSSTIHTRSIDTRFISKKENHVYSDLPKDRYAYITGFNQSYLVFDCNKEEKSFEVNSEDYYEIGFSGKSIGAIQSDLIVVGVSNEKVLDVKSIPMNTSQLLKFKNDVKKISFLIRLRGQGSLGNIGIGINKKRKEPTKRLSLSLAEDDWFNPIKSNVTINSKNDELLIDVKDSLKKTVYLSYQQKNSSFGKVPEKSAFPINQKSYYEITIKGSEYVGSSIQPILITYSNEKKEKIITLKFNEKNVIRFNEQITSCRIAFKVNETCIIHIQDFFVEEYKEQDIGGEMIWLDEKELGFTGLVESKPLKKVKLAAIFDEFTTQCFSKECDLITFSPDNWKETLSANKPDFLMVESAWRGNNETWVKKVQYTSQDSIKELTELLKWCNEKAIPTVFWNKEDPVHYEHFIETAKLFDQVLTTDKNMVPVYKEACGHENVDYLQFGAQPLLHNPITIGARENASSFAGSYYAKHIERSEDMLRIFNSALPFGLAIFDRNYEKVKQGLLKNNRYPEHLEPYIEGSLKYYEIDKAYKGYRVMINVNTVKNSPTMFARRVYEALASGTPVVSNYSEGIKESFGELVCVSEKEEEVAAHFEKLFNDEQEYRKIVLKGIREVLLKHTYAHRLEKIVKLLHLPFYRDKNKIQVFGRAEKIEDIHKITRSFKNQKIENKELCLITSSAIDESDIKLDDKVKIYNENNFFEQYSNILEYAHFDYLAVFSPENIYGENYLLDLNLAISYAPWEIISYSRKESLSFEQVETADPYLSIFKREQFNLLSLEEFFEMLDNQNLSLFKKRGARILGIPHSKQ